MQAACFTLSVLVSVCRTCPRPFLCTILSAALASASTLIVLSCPKSLAVPFCNFSDECIDLIRLIVDQAPLRGKISKKAYNKVKSQYTSRINAESYLDLIDGVSGIEKRALNCFKILKWHRPVASNTGKATLMNRLLIRCGILKVAGKFTV